MTVTNGTRVRKNIELDAENVDWYATTFPGGSLGVLLDQLLRAFRECVEHTPEEYVKLAARQLAVELRGGR